MSDRSEALGRAAAAYEALADLAESVEDEWQYVNDLRAAYGPAMQALAGDPAPMPPGAVEAIDEAIAEIALIEDPHRAIDWLSTFPHVVALAVGGNVDAPPAGNTAGEAGSGEEAGDEAGDEPDDDSPFRILLGGDR